MESLDHSDKRLELGHRIEERDGFFAVLNERGQLQSEHSHARFARRQLMLLRSAWLNGRHSNLPEPRELARA